METIPVIAIDGPSGSGKGTIARRLAKHLGFHWLDSGALYRCVGLEVAHQGVDPADLNRLSALIENIKIEFKEDAQGHECIQINGRDVSAEIRTEEAGAKASTVAAIPLVRDGLFMLQKNQVRAPGLVADGRDMGTVVFPQALLKVFLTASAEARAQRRYKQLKDKGLSVKVADLSKEIAERDERDANRAVAPLRPADDAMFLDSTNVSIEEVFSQVLEWTRQRLPNQR
jgi:cytidylate kinase